MIKIKKIKKLKKDVITEKNTSSTLAIPTIRINTT